MQKDRWYHMTLVVMNNNAYFYLNGGELYGVQQYTGWELGPVAIAANYKDAKGGNPNR